VPGQLVKRGENKWLVRVPKGRGVNGTRKYLNRTIHGTKKDAQRELTRLLRDRDTGVLMEPTRQLLGDFLQEWLDTTAKARVREVTHRSYTAWLKRTVLKSDLAPRRLSSVTAADLQGFLNGLTEEGYSPRSVAYVRAILRTALEQAVRWNKMVRNPAAKGMLTLPRQRRHEMRALGPEQAQTFLREAEVDEWFALWTLLITTGARPGEACGLKWSDLDGNRLMIRRALVWRYRGAWSLEEPKTMKARRTLLLPAMTVRALREHRRQQAAQRLTAGPTYLAKDFIFADPTGRPIDIRAMARRHFNRILQRAGIPHMRLYDLRHSAATLLLSAGVHVKVASEMLGHSTATLTLDVYSHVLEGMQAEAAATMERLLGKQQAV
jgi:integrase